MIDFVVGVTIAQLSLKLSSCRIETPKDVIPFPFFESLTLGNAEDPWLFYRNVLMAHGRSLYFDVQGECETSLTQYLSLCLSGGILDVTNCVIEGRVAACIVGVCYHSDSLS